MKRVDLSKFVSANVRVLIGHDRGVAIREDTDLDALDQSDEEVVIAIPSTLATLTPSFVQGFLAGSIRRLGEDRFHARYRFEAPPHLSTDIQAGIDRVLTSRHLAGV
jgi:hypothetical protein